MDENSLNLIWDLVNSLSSKNLSYRNRQSLSLDIYSLLGRRFNEQDVIETFLSLKRNHQEYFSGNISRWDLSFNEALNLKLFFIYHWDISKLSRTLGFKEDFFSSLFKVMTLEKTNWGSSFDRDQNLSSEERKKLVLFLSGYSLSQDDRDLVELDSLFDEIKKEFKQQKLNDAELSSLRKLIRSSEKRI
ncbi:MAG: hypothetical protein ACPGJV_15565 [Bacteriovoracaceae bacterium]